jgi:hypothetical protein
MKESARTKPTGRYIRVHSVENTKTEGGATSVKSITVKNRKGLEEGFQPARLNNIITCDINQNRIKWFPFSYS